MIYKTQYDHDNTSINPSDRWAREVVNKYNLKLKKLDLLFAPNVVGDKNNDIMVPF